MKAKDALPAAPPPLRAVRSWLACPTAAPCAAVAGSIFTIGLLAGCGGAEREPLQPVSGRVLYRGEPAENATVVLHPTEDGRHDALKPFGTTGPDGRFQISTYETHDGASQGEYRVTIVWPEAPPINSPDFASGEDRLGNQYTDPRHTPWQVQVKQQPLELEPFEVD